MGRSQSKYLTVNLHYGGTFDIDSEGSAYLGGETITFDYVDCTTMTLNDFKSIAEREGISKPMRVNAALIEENERVKFHSAMTMKRHVQAQHLLVETVLLAEKRDPRHQDDRQIIDLAL
ncbi:glutathione S-transferase tau 13 [Striga asiatica]|uniref:Glutathione S-transferase tau 13 n=1 Tax=Striga asiatica TaxID=4170 RepID=A0A5A7RBG1_STRAF|nr:glutathione S-transferase tau 13 [Striga asiatica]